MAHQLVIVLDFGGQYSHLIARRVRECGVYCEVWPYKAPLEKIKDARPLGIILTGGPKSVYAAKSPLCSAGLFEMDIPILGICYGAQLAAFLNGGTVRAADVGEYGRVDLTNLGKSDRLFNRVENNTVCWMSHTDFIARAPDGFTVTAQTANCPCAALENADRKIYAVQFHPEVVHTQAGTRILQNFLYEICGCRGDWSMTGYVARTIEELRQKIGDKKVICALSGGVDSTVASVMVHRAAGKNLTCIFIDHGLLRKGEGDKVEEMCRSRFDMNLLRIDAADRFLSKLSGVSDPEQKRKIIGEEFIRCFEEAGRAIGKVHFLVQGTIYPDIIESGLGDSAVIKSHHNVGGLPDVIDFDEIIEPLRLLFKDEVRKAGLELGIDESLVWRQPFPGPGLAVRIIGDITREKADLLREADAIFTGEIEQAGLARDIDQYFAVLTNMKSVGVMGDSRTYDYTIALRAVSTVDFMTADFSRIPYEVLAKVSSRIVNEVKHINRVVYDITPKPPATIEWE